MPRHGPVPPTLARRPAALVDDQCGERWFVTSGAVIREIIEYVPHLVPECDSVDPERLSEFPIRENRTTHRRDDERGFCLANDVVPVLPCHGATMPWLAGSVCRLAVRLSSNPKRAAANTAE